MSKEYTGAFLDLSGCAFKYRIRASVSPLPTSMIGPRMEAPILKVSRPVSACARCRNAKIRCDGKLPACSACERAGKSAECSSANDRFAKGKERSYVASLESRIEKLEKQLASKRGHGALDQSERKHHRSISDTAPRSSEALDVDDLVSDFGYLSVNATASGFRGFGKEMSFARLVLSVACNEAVQSSIKATLPARSSVTVLMQDSLDNVFSLYPVVTSTTLFGSLEACYQNCGHFATPLDRWIVHMVMAIVSLCKSTGREDFRYKEGVSYMSKALEEQDSVLRPGSVASCQAVLLLAIYSLLDPTHFNCWYLIGVASRLLVDIGAHQQPPTLNAVKKSIYSEGGLQRRLFYCTYSMDRLVSFSLVRAVSFSDDSVGIEPPSLTLPMTAYGMASTTSKPSAIVGDAFSMLVHFRRSQSLVYHRLFCSNRQNLYEPWQARGGDLRELEERFHDMASSIPDAHRQLFLAELYYMNILLVQPLTDMPLSCPYGLALLFEYSLGYAQSSWLLYQKQKHAAACTHLELLKACKVAYILLDVLDDPLCPAFSSHSPPPPPSSEPFLLPEVLKRPAWEATERAIEAMTQMDQLMVDLGERFGFPGSYGRLKTRLSSALLALRSRKELLR